MTSNLLPETSEAIFIEWWNGLFIEASDNQIFVGQHTSWSSLMPSGISWSSLACCECSPFPWGHPVKSTSFMNPHLCKFLVKIDPYYLCLSTPWCHLTYPGVLWHTAIGTLSMDEWVLKYWYPLYRWGGTQFMGHFLVSYIFFWKLPWLKWDVISYSWGNEIYEYS